MTSTDEDVGVRAVRALRAGDEATARALVTPVLDGLGLGHVQRIEFTSDDYSLNSVSGLLQFDDGPKRFFKFHAEEGEAEHVHEYYRAHLLKDAGLPVEVPLALNSRPGQQVVVYEVRDEPRMVDVCLDLERNFAESATLPGDLVAARRRLDATIGRVAVESLRPATLASADASVHQLFSRRLVDAHGSLGGTRFGDWYAHQPLWQRLSIKPWRIGGVDYPTPLAESARRAARALHPEVLARGPVVTAHGDDHDGNVWCRRDTAGDRFLTLFDPAFASSDIPALLALVKPTFHNALAHPFWLYHPDDVAALEVTETDDRIEVSGTVGLSPLRQTILDSIVEEAWSPLLLAMAKRGLLPSDWRATVRLALMSCPLLVTNLVAPHRSPDSQLVGLMHVAMIGSEPHGGSDTLTIALDRLEADLHRPEGDA